MGNPLWVKGGPSPNPRKARGREFAGLLIDEFNAPNRRGNTRKALARRIVDALDLGFVEFEERKVVKGVVKVTTRRIHLDVRNWIDLSKFVHVHIDGHAKVDLNITRGDVDDQPFALPADIIAPSFVDAYRDITQQKHTEYIFSGGRGSTKSSFVSLAIIYLIKNNPAIHALATRQVAATLRDSVYSQLIWAIGELGLSDEFKCITNPLEIEYLLTGQKIYFRGADDPGKIKSIKPTFGYIGLVWFEELDQFWGQESIRKVEQSVIRGGDTAFIFKSFNPPPTANNWANKYVLIPKDTQYQHKSTYLTVPPEWLGRTWLEEAEHLKLTNPIAYENEYMGIANNVGGVVFSNVRVETITDKQIKEFDRVLRGLDWGFYPDPASFGKMHYDAARRVLYIFDEARYWKMSNESLHDELVTKHDLKENDLIIADSAEPKSVNDFRAYGSNTRGAEKGPESVKYSIKWLQGLTAIVIDSKRAPYHAEEFLNYEFERTKDGEIISEYPDKNNHAIDDTRYATNLIWRRKGE